jgi:spore maturation protein CgeB
VLTDFEKAKTEGLQQYKLEMNEKVEILEYLIHNYNDGRRKNYYCIAVNLLSLASLKEVFQEIQNSVNPQDIDLKSKIEQIIKLFETRAKCDSIALKLRN